MSDVNIRQLALESLIEIIENGQFSNLVENQVLEKYGYLEKRDRAFYTRIVEGTLGSMLTLDYYINQLSKTKVNKMKPLIRNLMRMSAYQIFYMDSVPDSAAINEAVKLAKKRGFHQLSGFVNGVLRNLSRQKDALELPNQKDMVAYLSVKESVPEWIVKHFLEDYGQDQTEKILAALNQPQKMSVRCNISQIKKEALIEKLKEDLINATTIPGTENGLYLEGVNRPSDIQAFVDGDIYIQDASSMLVAEWAGVKKDDYCIDVCAAPGGKSTHIAQLLMGSGHVDARDLTDYKVSLIDENIDRLGLSNISAKVWDATKLDQSVINKADVLICDLPCSGLGIMGKKKDIRYNASLEGIDELVNIQRQILSVVDQYVKVGGTMIYSTCTICKKENEENVDWFLKEYPEFELVEMKQILPHEIGNDGFFIAKLTKKA